MHRLTRMRAVVPVTLFFVPLALGGPGEALYAVVGVDLSRSTGPAACDALQLITEGIVRRPYGSASNLVLLATGDDASANEPVWLASYTLPSSDKMGEGGGKIRREKRELPGALAARCRSERRREKSPVYLGLRSALGQLSDKGCGQRVECAVFFKTDGEENVETAIRRALDGQPLKKTLVGSLDNRGIVVTICGLAETVGTAEEGGTRRTFTPNRTDSRERRLMQTWTSLFAEPANLRLEPYCAQIER
jgi:hypothetical protein